MVKKITIHIESLTRDEYRSVEDYVFRGFRLDPSNRLELSGSTQDGRLYAIKVELSPKDADSQYLVSTPQSTKLLSGIEKAICNPSERA